MTNCEYIRARSPQQKEERFREIMRASEALFLRGNYHEVTLTTIAKELGWSRANLYKYVETKEEIFLQLYLTKQGKFIQDLLHAFESGEGQSDESFAEIIAVCYQNNLDYPRYQELQHSMLETNVSVEKLAEFELASISQRKQIFPYLKNMLPQLDDKGISNFYLYMLYQACGLYAHTAENKTLEEALALAGIPMAKDNFVSMMTESVCMYLKWKKDL